MPPRICDRIEPLPEFIFQWDGDAPIDRISAQWVFKASPPPPRVPSAEDAVPPEPPLPEAILEIYQDYNAGPADGVDREQPDFRADLYVNGHSNGYVNGREPETETVDTALDRASDALIAAGWEQVDEYYSKDFRHFYFKPPADQAWRPSRRLFNLNDPNQTAS